MSVWDDFKTWAKQPFSTNMDLVHWGLFVGLLLALLIFWRQILNHIAIGAE